MDASPKPHLSASQATLYGKCPEAYRRRYVLGDKRPGSVAQARGRALHRSAERNFRQKIASRVDLPRTEAVDFAVAAYDAEVAKSGVSLTAAEAAVGHGKILGAERDRAARLAGLFADEVAPRYQPEAVEEEQRIVLPTAPRDLLGVLDFTGHLVTAPQARGLADWKSGKARKPVGTWDVDLGLTVYALTFRARYGHVPAFVRVEEMVDTKVPRNVTTTTHRDVRDFQALVARLNAVLAAIEAGLFPPAPVGAWWCTPTRCAYWGDCKYVNGARQDAAAAQED